MIGPSSSNILFLSRWYGYSIDITDPKTAVLSPCESLSDPDFGQPQLSERIGHSRADGTEHFPLLLDARPERPRLGAYGAYGGPAWHRADSGWYTRVELVPIMTTPDRCTQVLHAQMLNDCTQLNTMAMDALQEELLPGFVGGMNRAAVHLLGGSDGTYRLGYSAVYRSAGVPTWYTPVMVEKFANAQSAIAHMTDFSRAIPNYDPAAVTEDEVAPGQKIKRITTTAHGPVGAASYAFWISENRLIMITFIPRSSSTQGFYNRIFLLNWLRHDPSTLNSLDGTSQPIPRSMP